MKRQVFHIFLKPQKINFCLLYTSVSVINAPTEDKPFGHCYTAKYLGNLVEGSVRYLNVEMNELKDLVIKQMKDGELVWFGSDCSKYADRTFGIWDQEMCIRDR